MNDHGPEGLRVALAGIEPRAIPFEVTNITWSPLEEADALMIAGDLRGSDIDRILEQLPNPLIPKAIFGSHRINCADYNAPQVSKDSFFAGLTTLTEIHQRLKGLPDIKESHHEIIMVLRHAFSRKGDILAHYVPQLQDTVGYPTLPPYDHVRDILENLANKGMLRRRFFTRLQRCNHCRSGRCIATQTCPHCNSADLNFEPLIHHITCNHQDTEASFSQQGHLICPKCETELNMVGVDYERTDSRLLCSNCQKTVETVETMLECMDCHHQTPLKEAGTRDYFHYHLTDMGQTAALEGQLPPEELDTQLRPISMAYSLNDFILLAEQGSRVAERFNHPFAIACLTIENRQTLMDELGRNTVARLTRRMLTIMSDLMREYDVLSSHGETLYLYLPQTEPNDIKTALTRLDERMKEDKVEALRLTWTVVEGEDAIAALEELTLSL